MKRLLFILILSSIAACSSQKTEEPPMPESKQLTHIQFNGVNFAGHNDSVNGHMTDSELRVFERKFEIQVTQTGTVEKRNRTAYQYRITVSSNDTLYPSKYRGTVTPKQFADTKLPISKLQGEYIYYSTYRNSGSLEKTNSNLMFSFKR